MSSAQHGFTPLSRLTLSNNRCRVRVRISRMWVSFNPDNGVVFGLDSLLIDDEGKTMQAHVDLKDIKRLEERLAEGKVYVLSGFTVCVRQKNFMTCRNDLMLRIGAQMVVEDVDGYVNSIPLHVFEFVDFRDVPCRSHDKSLLTDVIGQIVEVCGMQQAPKQFRTVELFTLSIQDLSGTEQCVTLYGKLGHDFYVEIRKKSCRPVVAVFAGMCVRYYKGNGFTVCSSSASKYYLDLEIPEVQEFRANLHHPQNPIVHLPSQQEIPVNPTQESQSFSKRAQELQSSWRTIKQLKSLNPLELQNRFLCRVSLVDIDCTRGWFYLGCFHCRLSIGDEDDGSEVRCSQCGAPDRKLETWYKLDAVVEDATGTMNLMIFAEQAESLIGVPAKELIGEDTEDDDDRYTMPGAIRCILGSIHTFEVAMDKRCSRFALKWVLNEDDLALLRHSGGSTQMILGWGGVLPKEEGCSSVSSCCSSHLMEEKMVVKGETELKNEDEAEPPSRQMMQNDLNFFSEQQ